MNAHNPIRPVGPTPTAGLEAGLQRAPAHPRVAVRALSPITNRPAAYSQTALEAGLSARPRSMDLTRGRAEILPPGPAALLAAHSAALDSMVQAFRKGLGLPEEWTPKACAKRALEDLR